MIVDGDIWSLDRRLPYPGSTLGERSGRTDNTATDLVPGMVSCGEVNLGSRDASRLLRGRTPWSTLANGSEDSFRVARDSGGIPRTRYDPLRTRSLLRIGERPSDARCERQVRNCFDALLFSFRMIGDTRIECRHASSQRETARFWPTSSDRG